MTDKQALFLKVIRAKYPALDVRTVHMLAHGQFNDILVINEELIFRFPKYPESIASLKKETAVLQFLQGKVSLPVPDPVYLSVDEENPGRVFMGYTLLPGRPLWRKTLEQVQDENTLDRLAGQLAHFLEELHRISPVQLGLDLPVSDGLQAWIELYQDIRAHLYAFMRPEARQRVDAHFEAFIEDSRLHAFTPVLRHGDFGSTNILFNPATMDITGIIDFGFAGIGDPALDLAGASTFGERFFARLCVYYPGVESMQGRVKFYRGTFALMEALHGWRNNDREAFKSGMADFA